MTLFTHTEALLRYIQAYLAPCVTLTYSPPCHIPEVYSTLCETLIRHIQNLVLIRTVYSGIIQAYSEPCVTPGYAETWDIFGILEYSTPFYNCIRTYIQNTVIFTKIGKPSVTLEIQNPGILTILEYSEP